MPIIHSAKKKQRQDLKRTAGNDNLRRRFKRAVALTRKEPSADHLHAAFSQLDRAAHRHIIHKNKAARIKRKLAHLAG